MSGPPAERADRRRRRRPRDMLVVDGRIRSLGVAKHDLLGLDDLDIVDLEGRFVGPGLWDAHVHVGQWALQSSRLDVSAARSAAETVALVQGHLDAHPLAAGTVLVGSGFRDGLWADAPAAGLLDIGDVPVALVSGDVHTVWSNTAALRMMGLPETDWLLREQPAFDLNVRLSDVPAAQLDEWVLEAAARAAARGVVGISDFEFDDAPGAWVRRFAAGFRGLRVRALVYPPHLDAAIAAGIRTGLPIGGWRTTPTVCSPAGRSSCSPTARSTPARRGATTRTPGSTVTRPSGMPTYRGRDLLDLARVGVPARPRPDHPRDRRPGDGGRARHVRGARDPARRARTSRPRPRQHPARAAGARRGSAALRRSSASARACSPSRRWTTATSPTTTGPGAPGGRSPTARCSTPAPSSSSAATRPWRRSTRGSRWRPR